MTEIKGRTVYACLASMHRTLGSVRALDAESERGLRDLRDALAFLLELLGFEEKRCPAGEPIA